jgi:hypothetical protein
MKRTLTFLFSLAHLLTGAQPGPVVLQHLDAYGNIRFDSSPKLYTRAVTGTPELYSKVLSISDPNGRKLLKKGNGTYFGPLGLVYMEPPGSNIPVPYRYPAYGTLEEPFREFMEFFDALPGGVGEFYGKGKFKDGLKEGVWYEGEITKGNDPGKEVRFDVNSYAHRYAAGNYVKGKKEGLWEYHDRDVVFYGQFVNGKREGEWKSKKIVIGDHPLAVFREGDRYVYPIDGGFKNGAPDGVWVRYERDSGRVNCKGYYHQGKYLGLIEYHYPSGRPEYQADVRNDSIVNKRFYCPEGALIDVKNARSSSGYIRDAAYAPGFDFPDGHTHTNGYDHTWQVHWGGKEADGWYVNGKMDSVWRTYEWKDTTSEVRYRKGETWGRYWRTNGNGKEAGYYCGNWKHCSTWVEEEKDADGRHIKSELSGDGEIRLLKNYWVDDRQTVSDGFGVVTEVMPFSGRYYKNDHVYEEIFYIDGKPYKSVMYYGKEKNEQMTRWIVYHLPGGDSLSDFWDESHTQTVKGGYGEMLQYESFGNEIAVRRIYVGGKVLSEARGNISNIISAIHIRKEIVKHTATGVYEVTVTISKGALKGFAKYTDAVSLGEGAIVNVISAPEATLSFLDHKVKFVWVQLPPGDELALHYTVSGVKELEKVQAGVFRFAYSNTANDVVLLPGNVTWTEVK